MSVVPGLVPGLGAAMLTRIIPAWKHLLRHACVTVPNKVYYVIDIAKIVGPAPITPDPVHPTIPYGAFKDISKQRKKREYQDARPDSSLGRGDGSPLYIVNKWAFKWGL